MERRTDPILITGATGFLGGHTVRSYLDRGFKVRATGRNRAFGESLTKLGAEFIPAELTIRSDVEKIIRGVGEVVHCAALASNWGAYSDFYQANVVSTENVARAALRAGVRRVVYISTPSIYVEARHQLGIRESDPLPGRSVGYYAETKLLAEEALDRAVADGLRAITLRPQGIIGIGDTAIFPRVLRIARKGYFPIIGDRKVMMDLTAVENVVHAIECARVAPDAALGKKFNITNGEPVNNAEMIAEVLRKLGIKYRERPLSHRKAMIVAAILENVYRALPFAGEPPLTRYTVCALGYSRTLNIESAEREIGYRPIVPFGAALERTLEWLKASGS